MKGEFYHLLNRGVEKRKVFLDEEDYLRFVHDLYDFNDIKNANQSYYRRRHSIGMTDVRRPSDELADILCWCLLPNHPHIMVVDKKERGISDFSKKVFGGYTKYFNEKNKRSGVLFQGRSKIILVSKENHFLYLPFYIHANPLDLFQPDWRTSGVKNLKKAMKFLESYKWSNYSDIISLNGGKKNFSNVTNKKLFYKLFQTNAKKYKKDFEEWLRNYRPKCGEYVFDDVD